MIGFFIGLGLGVAFGFLLCAILTLGDDKDE